VLNRVRYLARRVRGLFRHVAALHRGAAERGRASAFRRTVLRLATGSITRLEQDIHHWAATVEGLDHPVMAGVEAETRGLAELAPAGPAFDATVVVLVDSVSEDAARRCLDSVRRQSRPAARVAAVCRAGRMPEWRDRLPAWVDVVETDAGGGGWRRLIEGLDTPYALLVGGDGWLRPDLLYRFGLVQRIVPDPAAVVIAAAPVAFNPAGEVIGRPRTATRHRPSFPVLLASEWLEGAVLVPTASWRRVAGAADPAAGMVQVAVELVSAGLHLELVPVALCGRPDPDSVRQAPTAARARALERMLRAHVPSGLRIGPDARLEPLAPAASSLQIVVPYRDRPDMTLTAIRALLDQDFPAPVEVVAVDNGSRAGDLAGMLAGFGVRALRADEPFNYSRLNNRAVAGGSSDLLLFVNNDVVLERGALRSLAEWAQVPAVGAVGAVLTYPDGRLQHAGLERDPHGPADEVRWTLPERGLDPPQLVRARRTGLVDAVTGACLMTRRSVFDEVGGFDEVFYPNAFSDTDLCRRITAAGRVCLVTPSARGVHDESASRRYDRLEDFEGSAWLEQRLADRRRQPATADVRSLGTGRPRQVLHGFDDLGPIGTPAVDVVVAAAAVDREAAQVWLGQSGVLPLRVVAVDGQGGEAWREGARDDADEPARRFVVGGRLQIPRSDIERRALIALSEDVDAVVEAHADTSLSAPELELSAAAGGVFARRVYVPTGADAVSATADRRVVRIAPPAEPLADESAEGWDGVRDRVADRYRCSFDLGQAPLPVAVRRVWYGLNPEVGEKPTILVLAPYLAHGGAEQTLFEVLRELRERFRFVIATLVQHREILGDRRSAFAGVADAVVSLGEITDGDALSAAVEGLVALTSAEVVYNANGSDAFYRAAAHLKARRPTVRIIDHLYDHVHGYVSAYHDREPSAVDTCIAENHLIERTLVNEREWPAERVRVVWPCGRRAADLPEPAAAADIRRRLRGELGIGENDVLFLTAARLHPQKRPLDLAALAARLADRPEAVFLWVGGGELEDEFDRVCAVAAGGRVRRLPFRSDVPELAVAADVGCLVSEYEGLPVFMLECLQLGRPFLATDTGDVGRVLTPARAGIVAGPPGDLDRLERAARDLCGADLRIELGRNAAAAAERFSPARAAADYAEVFAAPEAGPGGRRSRIAATRIDESGG